MMYVRPMPTDPKPESSWPPIPEGMSGVQIVAVARMIERVCGTASAASYLAEAIAAFDKRARSFQANYIGHYSGAHSGSGTPPARGASGGSSRSIAEGLRQPAQCDEGTP
jgi:hypothetical protein